MADTNKPDHCLVCREGKNISLIMNHIAVTGAAVSLYECAGCEAQFWFPFINPGSQWYEGTSNYGIKEMTAPKIYRRFHKEFLQRHQSFSPGTTALELGCGSGEFMDAIRKRGATVFGVDFDRKAVALARTFFHLQNTVAMPFDEFFQRTDLPKFDYLFFFEVIEHVDNPLEFIQRAKGLLKPGGKMAASTPSCERALVNWNHWDFPPHHLTRWNRQALENLFKKAGLVVHYFRYVEQFGMLLGAIDGKFRSGMVNKAANASTMQDTSLFFAKALYLLARAKYYALAVPAVFLWVYGKLTGRHNGIMYVELKEI